MRHRACHFLSIFLMAIALAGPALAQPTDDANESKSLPSIDEKTQSMARAEGYFVTYWDEREGKLWLEIDKLNQEFLYVNSLSAGVGSNDIGLDRGQLGASRVVEFRRVGPRLLLVQPNYDYRAESDDPEERRAVREAFAESVLWGFKIEAEQDGHVLVDATDFLLRDAHGVIGSLKRSDQGAFKLEASRSAISLERTKNFPRNTEFDAILTFTGDSPGSKLRSVTPSAAAVTVHQHHSFLELPDGDYQPRLSDPRAGYFPLAFMDFATPITEPIVKRYIRRHRLVKKNPSAEQSEPVEPIIYYLDRGTPEPVRSALLDGARWWNEAYEAAGFIDAFRVELMPAGADPLDARYNVIQWVHRSTRGWSYGSSVTDPRTGEIIKGHVTLGSLRVRQDYLIAEALLAPYESDGAVPPEMEQLALARLRQLAAHEVGHTLGLAHNFASSANGNVSVMDYPHPYVKLGRGGALDLSEAYGVGIGEWDKVAIRYGYTQFPPQTNEKQLLESMIKESLARGLRFLSDSDARAPGGAHPTAHLWDNGPDAAQELLRILKVRAAALERFSEKNIRPGAPMASLEDALAPLFLLHRYQTEAAAKVLGGLDYSYAVRGDGQVIAEPLDGPSQRAALEALLKTIEPETLALPERILRLIPPQPHGRSRGRENFRGRTGPSFDPLAAAETAAGMTLALVLHPQRANRLVEFHARDSHLPSLAETLNALIDSTWKSDPLRGLAGEVGRVVDDVVLDRLIDLAADSRASNQVRAIAQVELFELAQWLGENLKAGDDGQVAHRIIAVRRINKFLDDPTVKAPPEPPAAPDGSPIGAGQFALEEIRCDW